MGLFSLMRRRSGGEENLLLNSGFEDAGGGGADIWANWLEIAGNGVLTDELVNVHSGNHAAKFTAGASKNTQFYQAVTVVPGAIHNTSFWTRGDGSNDIRFQIYDFTNSASIINKQTGITGTTYTQFNELDWTVPAGCVQVYIYFKCSVVEAGVGYVDDVRMW